MAVAADALLVADGLGEGLAEGDADILDGVVVVDMQIALALDVQVDQAVAGDLVEHVLKERHADIEARLASAIQVDRNLDLGFQGVAFDGRRTFGHHQLHKMLTEKAGIIGRHGCMRLPTAVARGLHSSPPCRRRSPPCP
ncbi:hypothetical protein D9M70_323920 [compost metagenome]